VTFRGSFSRSTFRNFYTKMGHIKGGQNTYFLIQKRHFRAILPTPRERSAKNTYPRLKKSVSGLDFTDFMVQNIIFIDFFPKMVIF